MGAQLKKILGVTLLLAGLVLCGAGLWLLLSPAQYRATARIKVEQDWLNTSGGVSYDPYFIQTEFEVIQSELILGKVIESLNLNAEWGEEYFGGGSVQTNKVMAFLRSHLRLAPVRGTKLIEISFLGNDPRVAAAIANAVAKAYRDFRLEQRQDMRQQGIKALANEFQKRQLALKEKREKLEELGRQLNVPETEPVDELLKTNYPAFYSAKQELEEAIKMARAINVKIAAEPIICTIPQTLPVRIIDVAIPPQSPASPSRPFGVALLVIGLVVTLGGGVLLKSSRRLPR